MVVSVKHSDRKSKSQIEFQTEAALVRTIIKNRRGHKKGAARLTPNALSEFESSAGRADIVFFHLHSRWRKNSEYGQLPARWVYTLRTLPLREEFTAEDFSIMTGVTRQTATRILMKYERLGYCQRLANKRQWLKVRQPIPIVKRIIAIEAKLMDWRRAMSQAYQYQRYANQSWVVLDASKARGALEAKEQFQRLNVGLKVLTRAGVSKTYVTPRLKPAKSPYHFWEANGLIAASLSGPKKL